MSIRTLSGEVDADPRRPIPQRCRWCHRVQRIQGGHDRREMRGRSILRFRGTMTVQPGRRAEHAEADVDRESSVPAAQRRTHYVQAGRLGTCGRGVRILQRTCGVPRTELVEGDKNCAPGSDCAPVVSTAPDRQVVDPLDVQRPVVGDRAPDQFIGHRRRAGTHAHRSYSPKAGA